MSRELPGITDKELLENFTQCLNAAIDLGQYSGTDLGLDAETRAAIDAVADSYPNIDEALIQKALRIFASQPLRSKVGADAPANSAALADFARRRFG